MSIKSMTNWKEKLDQILDGEKILEINIAGDVYDPEILDVAFKRLERKFDDGSGGHEGESFWAWTKTSVYFCGVYGGAEWLEKIPRNPQTGIPHHVGGE